MAVVELVFAGALWGFGFTAAIWCLEEIGPLMATGWRLGIASVVGLAICYCLPSLRPSLNKKQFMLAAIPGVFLSLTLILQTWGLTYTTATKSGFITTLYVLMVPILEQLFLKRRVPRFHFFYVFVALIGTALICDLPAALGLEADTGTILTSSTAWNIGDFLTLLCALFASFHIIWFAVISEQIESPFAFNVQQTIWACVAPITMALWLEDKWHFPTTALPIIGLMALTFGATLIAFAFQIKAQKKISPSLASLLFLLESPFATLFAIYFLSENLKAAQWVGAGLILIAAALSVVFSRESADPASAMPEPAVPPQ
jgi:drug/metabolite transporter (DMT)-like permease